jgi:hypothetical protein
MHKTAAAGLKVVAVKFNFSVCGWLAWMCVKADVEQCMQCMTGEFRSRHNEWTEQEWCSETVVDRDMLAA